MKIRVKLPDNLATDYYSNGVVNEQHYRRQEFIDDILMWGMETEIDIAFYSYYWPADKIGKLRNREMYAVFTVEEDYSYMFSLKWGALMHKGNKNKELT